MKITFRTAIAACLTLIIPGLGQLFYGKILWAMFWMMMGILTGGTANIVAAIHILFLDSK